MSPRTHLIPLGALSLGALMLAAACGTPPEPPLKSPPLAGPSLSAAPLSLPPPLLPTTAAPTVAVPPTAGGAYPTYPVYPTYPAYPAGVPRSPTPPSPTSPKPTPSHAAPCPGPPTGAQIVAMLKNQKSGIPPNAKLKVSSGPYCSGEWSFTTVELSGETPDQLEPLLVVATGKDATLTLVAAGSDVCTNRVETTAPPGIRVLACGA